MGAGFYNNRDTRIYQLASVTAESASHAQGSLSLALRFRLKTLTGTTEVPILSNGSFEIRRTSGTAANFEVFYTNGSGTTSTVSLGTLAVDTDYLVVVEGSAITRAVRLNGVHLGAVTGQTWNPGSAAKWFLGPDTTDIDVEIYEFGIWHANLTAGNLTTLEGGNYFNAVDAANLNCYYGFTIEYYGTFNESDENCANQGTNSSYTRIEPVLTTAVGSWTGDDPLVDTADVSIQANGVSVADGGTIEINSNVTLTLTNADLSNAAEIIAVTYESDWRKVNDWYRANDPIDQQITIAADDSEVQAFLIPPENIDLTITFHGKGRIFNSTNSTYTITLQLRPDLSDQIYFVEEILATHIRGHGEVII